MYILTYLCTYLLVVLVQLCADGRTLLDTLQMPVSSGSCNSLTAKADYTEGASHVLDVVHEVILSGNSYAL